MMDLTPLDVRKKREDLRRVVRGYDPAQVDAFMDVVADRIEELVQEEVRLSEQVRMLGAQLQGFQERDRALNEALIAAQELREEARSQAEKAADLRMQEAGQEAERLVVDARRAVEDSRRSLRDLQARRSGFLRGMRAMLEKFLEEVAFEEERRVGEEKPEETGEAASAERPDGDGGAPADEEEPV